MPGHIVETGTFHPRLHKVVIRIVVENELDLGEVTFAIAETLGQVNAV